MHAEAEFLKALNISYSYGHISHLGPNWSQIGPENQIFHEFYLQCINSLKLLQYMYEYIQKTYENINF